MTLTIEDVRAGYGRATVLRGVDLTVDPGEVVAVIGSNGAGKTTLARTIAGALRTQSGTITEDGDRIDKLSPQHRSRRGIVLVPEGRRLFPSLTVAENIAIGRRAARGRNKGPDPVDGLLAAFPVVRERWGQRAGLLSGGEQQMVALTRAVASRPRYLLLDEPSLGLSPLLTQEVFRLIRLVIEQTGAGVVLVEQMADQALDIANRAYVLEQGSVVLTGPAEQVRQSDTVKAAYLGGSTNPQTQVSPARDSVGNG